MDAPGSGQPDEEDLLGAMQAARAGEEAGATAATATAATATAGGSEAADVATAKDAAQSSAPSEPVKSRRRFGLPRRRRFLVAALLAVVAIAVGASFGLGGFASPAASATPGASPSTAASRSAAASLTPGPSTSGLASAVVPASAQPSASQSLVPQTAPTAQVTFNELVLYPSLTAAKQPATFTFVSDGPGLVSASIVASAPRDASRICLSGDGGTPVCASGATPTASFASQSIQSKWTVTVGSQNEESPTVDVQITWPSNKASITASHVPFQGHPNRDSLRSLTATFTAHAAGSAGLAAEWPGSSVATLLTVWLVDPSGQHVVEQKNFAAAAALPASTGFGVKAGATYRMTLANESDVSATNPDLTATLQLP